MADEKPVTPMLDELEERPMAKLCQRNQKRSATNAMAKDLLGQLELSYEEKRNHWKHGGIVGVLGYGGGVIGRYSDLPRSFRQWRISTPCASTTPQGGFTPARRCGRCVTSGRPWIRANEHARFDGRSRFSGNEDRPIGTHVSRTHRSRF